MATQQGDREHEDWNENHKQRKFNHGRVKNTCALGGPSFPCEASRLQADDKNAPNRGNQTHDEEGLHGKKNVRTDGDTNRVQNLHNHEDDQQLIEHAERFQSGIQCRGWPSAELASKASAPSLYIRAPSRYPKPSSIRTVASPSS